MSYEHQFAEAFWTGEERTSHADRDQITHEDIHRWRWTFYGHILAERDGDALSLYPVCPDVDILASWYARIRAVCEVGPPFPRPIKTIF